MKRRRFLTQTAHVLAAIGLSEFVLNESEAQRVGQHWQAIAANEGRRMALLVGIDRYLPTGQAIDGLLGCKQDVELQQQLLHCAFGFPIDNITTVLDEAATGDCLTAELQRLAVLLKPEDCLVVHFSGYGTGLTQVTEATGIAENSDPVSPPSAKTIACQPAIVLADAIALPLAELSDRLRLIPARTIIVTIDASYVLPTSAYSQELRSRVIRESTQSMLTRPNSTLAPIQGKTPITQTNPAASRPLIITYSGGLATERRWSDFDAGVLTYVLTQSLWHLGSTSNWQTALAATVEDIERSLGSPPSLQARNTPTIEPWIGGAIESGLVPTTPTSTIGAVSAHSPEKLDDLELWLGGLPPAVLSNYAVGSIVTVDWESIVLQPLRSPSPSRSPSPTESSTAATTPLSAADPAIPVDPSASVDGTLASQITAGDRPEPVNLPVNPPVSELNELTDRHLWLRISRDRGLRRAARPLQTMTESLVDRAIFEVVRVIPRFIQLGVALEAQLSRIERVDATSALSGLRGVEAITSADREADCWFGYSLNGDSDTASPVGSINLAGLIDSAINPNAELSAKSDASFVNSVSSRKRYTLLAFDRQPIFDCPPEPDEAIKRTVRRLQPHLQDLRAFKILAATENTATSMLKVRVTYGLAQTDPTVTDRGLRRTRQTAAIPTPLNAREISTLTLPSGSRMQYRIENLSDQPLFLLLVRLDACGRLTIPDTDEQIVRSRDVLTVPGRPEATIWNLERDPGLVRLFAILSDRPFQQTRDSLTRNHATGSRDLGRETESHDLPGEVAEAIVADLDRASRDRLPGLDFSADTYALDVRRWATLPLIYRITDPELA